MSTAEPASSSKCEAGILYCCGLAKFGCLPVAAACVDKSGECCYPAPVKFPAPHVRIVTVSDDMGIVGAIDDEGWLWGFARADSCVPTAPTRLQANVTAVAVGASFIAFISDNCCFQIGDGPAETGAPLPSSASRAAASSTVRAAPIECGPARDVAACNNSMLVLLHDGSVWSCGEAVTR